MIDPDEIPEFTGDLAALATDIKGLNGNAGKIRGTGQKVHTDFQGLSAYYHAPEAEQLFATTKPVQDRADQFAGKLEKVTAALDAYSTEVRPIIARLKQLRIDAAAFVKECGHGDHWKYDGGKVKRNNSLMHDVAAATAAFWDAERRAANAITALVGGTHWTTDDGSHKPGMYGYGADDLEHAGKTPWGSQDSQKHHIYDVGHWVKAFVWDGLIIDGAWSTLKGLGTLAGFGGWEAFKQSWTGLGHLAVGMGASSLLGPAGLPLLLMTPDKALPGFLKDGKHAVINAGKSMVAWDEWGKNPARAAGAVTFNVLTAVATDGAGDAAKAGSVAKAISIAGKGGRLIDPMTYVMKGAGLGLTKLKVGDMLGNLKNLHAGTSIKLPDDTVKLPDSSLPHPDGTVHVPDGVPVHTVPGDPVHVPDGVPGHPGASVHVPEGTPAHPAGPAHAPHEGAAHPGYPDSSADAPHESAPHAPAPHPAGSVRMPGGDVLHPDGTLVKPDGTIDHTVPSEMSAADRQALADAQRDLHQAAPTLVHAGGPEHEAGHVGDPAGAHDPGGVRASNDPPAGGGGGGGPHDPPTHNPPVHTGPTHDPAPPAHPGGGGSHPGGGGGHSGGTDHPGGEHPGGGHDGHGPADDAPRGAHDGNDPAAEAARHRAEYEAARAKPADERTAAERAAITREHVRLVNHDPAWRAQHYDKWGIGKRNNARELVDGQLLPTIVEKPDGGWMPVHELPYSSAEKFHLNSLDRGRHTVDPHELHHLDDVSAKRVAGMDRTSAEKAHNAHGTQANADALHEAQKHFTETVGDGVSNNSKLGENLGEQAARRHLLKQPEFAGAKEIEDLPHTANGSKSFDQLWRDKDGHLVIVEVKGPTARLEWRHGNGAQDSGTMVKQGTIEYVRTIVADMQERAVFSPKDKEYAEEIRKAIKAKTLRYVLVQATENSGKYAGAELKYFKMF